MEKGVYKTDHFECLKTLHHREVSLLVNRKSFKCLILV